jgi:hypothetical protein
MPTTEGLPRGSELSERLRRVCLSVKVFNMSGFFNYTIAFGGRTIALPPGIRIQMGGVGAATVETVNMAPAKRYRLSFNAQVQNLTNHRNYTGYSGLMTSPFFLTPTSVAGTRKVDVGMTFSF